MSKCYQHVKAKTYTLNSPNIKILRREFLPKNP